MAQTIRDLVLETARPLRIPRRAWLAAAFLSTFMAGFLACLLWLGGVLTLLGANVAGIRQEIADRHPVVKVSAGKAWRDIRSFNARQNRLAAHALPLPGQEAQKDD